MAAPLISVLIPAYNSARWITDTLQSVLAQTHRPIEIIVADDGSTDDTVTTAIRFAGKGVKVLRLEHGGASAARNAAFNASRGEYIQFLDADDLISPNKLECQLVRLMEKPGAVATCSWGRFNLDPREIRLDPSSNWKDCLPVEWLVEGWQKGGGMLFPAMWLVPRTLVERAGPWREDLSLNDDGEFFTRVALASRQVLFCSEATAFYRSGFAGNLSAAKSLTAWQSGLMSIQSCVDETLKIENSERVRRCGSLLWQVYAHAAFPYQPTLANTALRNAGRLHRIKINPDGGPAFRLLSMLLGWKAARVLQRWSGRQ